MKNKVLVLLSTYNGEKYVYAQLESILSQKNVELSVLCRDDGSEDNTFEIVLEFVQTHKNLKETISVVRRVITSYLRKLID